MPAATRSRRWWRAPPRSANFRMRFPIPKAARCSAAALSLAVSACATAEVAAPAPPPEIPRIVTLARTDDFSIVNVRPGVTFADLAEDFLGDAALGDYIAAVNGMAAPKAGQPVIVPLRAVNGSGVSIDGYQTVPILCYHRFTEGRSTDQMVMPRASFAQQMEYLKNNNYRVISLAELEGFLAASRPIPPRAVVITVDDGFRSAYDIAYPILKEYGFHATFFIYTDFIGPRLALDWAAINEMRASGIVDIQSHSKTHTSFSAAPGEDPAGAQYAARLTAEVDQPQRIFERQLGAPVRYLAYPYGDTSRRAVQLLGQRGFALALTVERGANPSFGNPFVLRREMIFGDATLADFEKSLRVFTPADLK